MTTLLRMILVGCALIITEGGLRAQLPDEIRTEVVPVADGAIIVRTLTPQATNVIALESEAGIIVIDTEVSPILARAIRSTIAKTFGHSDFAYVINTHHHGDHTYGNQVFSDAIIIGQEGVPAKMKEAESGRQETIAQVTAALPSLQQALQAADPETGQARSYASAISYYEAVRSGLADGFHLTTPTLTFRDRMSLRAGRLTLELVYFGLAHSDTDILVFCPALNLIATGDLFVPGEDPYVDSERRLQLDRWIGNLDHMLSDLYVAATLIPGHGANLEATDIRRVRDFALAKKAELAGKNSAFSAFRDAFEKEGLNAGLAKMDELRAHPDSYFFIHNEFDSYVYRMMQEGDLDPVVRLFARLTVLFPDVPNAFDSLGEAYFRKGDKGKAREAFEKCLELDPEHEHARARLEELRGPG